MQIKCTSTYKVEKKMKFINSLKKVQSTFFKESAFFENESSCLHHIQCYKERA